MADSTAKLEAFILLARSSKGSSAAKLVFDATAAPGVYTFAELIDQPNIQALSSDPSFEKHVKLLNLFAYGSLTDYLATPDAFPPLTTSHTTKLKHLTLVSLAHKQRTLGYQHLLETLQISSTRELEDLIIDVIYSGLLGGKIHHHEQVLHVDWVAGRDVSPSDLVQMRDGLANWCRNASTLLSALDVQINQARERASDDALYAAEYNRVRDATYQDVVSTGWQKILHESSKRNARSGGGGGGGGGSSGVFGPTSSGEMEAPSFSTAPLSMKSEGDGRSGRMANLARSAEQGEAPSLRASKRSKD